jgi:hypothetical protein
MRRFPAVRIVTMIAILLVATSVSAGAIGVSDCECCGPRVGAQAAPVAPCCIGTAERRVALFTHPHVTTLPAARAESHLAVLAESPSRVEVDGYPPGSPGPLYLRHSVLRI